MVFNPRIYLVVAPLVSRDVSIYTTALYQGVDIPVLKISAHVKAQGPYRTCNESKEEEEEEVF